MDNRKFEQLIDMIINENEEQARELFHEIVVEKSREIYESIMDEEMEEEGMVGEVGDLMDEINAEEAGGMVEDEEMDFEGDDDGEVIDIDSDDMSDEAEHEDIEDAVIRIEDKLDQLMAEFEEIMGGDEGDMGADDEEDMGDEEGDEEDMGDEEGAEEDMMEDSEDDLEEEDVMEAITLKKVSVTHGDNGQNTKSTNWNNSGQAGMDSKPVKFSGDSESVPTSPKGASNVYSKGEGQVKHAGQWKNAPAQSGQDLEKAPAPKKGDDGSNAKSPVAESRKSSRKIIR